MEFKKIKKWGKLLVISIYLKLYKKNCGFLQSFSDLHVSYCLFHSQQREQCKKSITGEYWRIIVAIKPRVKVQARTSEHAPDALRWLGTQPNVLACVAAWPSLQGGSRPWTVEWSGSGPLWMALARRFANNMSVWLELFFRYKSSNP